MPNAPLQLTRQPDGSLLNDEQIRLLTTATAMRDALLLVLAMHAMPGNIYRDKIGAMDAARAAIKAYKEKTHA